MEISHKEISAKGGRAKSEKKRRAVIENAKKPRGVFYTSIAYEYESDADGSKIFGAILVKGQPPLDMEKNHKWFVGHIEAFPGNSTHKVKEFIKLASMSIRIKSNND